MVEKEEHKLKPKLKKTRKKWAINPHSRIHGEIGYKRSKQKQEAREVIEEELEETGD